MTDKILAALRHDVHKFFGRSHRKARSHLDGIRVNQPVPKGADGDAAALSRPQKRQKQTIPTHKNHYRLSLLTGDTPHEFTVDSKQTIKGKVMKLVEIENPDKAHRNWLRNDIAARFNESVYYPYTSLKYHTLLVTALLDNYQAGNEFSDLKLIADLEGNVKTFRTIFESKKFTLHLDAEEGGLPSARLGDSPWQSWASVWNRLTEHPLDVNNSKVEMLLDANLRRIQSWSVALQYIEEYYEWREY